MYDESHVIQVDELEVRDNLTVETWPVRVGDREVKRLRGKDIILVKVIWVGPTGESATWELESRMKDSLASWECSLGVRLRFAQANS